MSLGPAEASRRLGIPLGSLKGWASRARIRWDPTGELNQVIVAAPPEAPERTGSTVSGADTDTPTTDTDTDSPEGPTRAGAIEGPVDPIVVRASLEAPEVYAARAAAVHEKIEMMRAYAQAQQADLRSQIRLKMLEKILDLLERMDKPHVDFKGKEADQVTYPIAPAEAVRAYAQSVATLLKEYRNEIGEAGETTNTTVTPSTAPTDHEQRILKSVIDEAIAIAEGRAAEAEAEAEQVEPEPETTPAP